MSKRIRNLSSHIQKVTFVRPNQTYTKSVFPNNFLVVTDAEYEFINPPLIPAIWSVEDTHDDVIPPEKPSIPASSEIFTTDDLVEGNFNLYFTANRARNAVVEDKIEDGVSKIAPSQNAVRDALNTKLDLPSVANTTLTAGQVRNLNTNPVQLVAAPEAGNAIVVESTEMFYDYSGSEFSTVGDITIKYQSSGTIMTFSGTGFIDQPADQRKFKFNTGEKVANQEAIIMTATSNFSGGGASQLKVRVRFRKIPTLS